MSTAAGPPFCREVPEATSRPAPMLLPTAMKQNAVVEMHRAGLEGGGGASDGGPPEAGTAVVVAVTTAVVASVEARESETVVLSLAPPPEGDGVMETGSAIVAAGGLSLAPMIFQDATSLVSFLV